VAAGQAADGHGAEPGPAGGPVAEAGPDHGGEPLPAPEGRNGTPPGLPALDEPGETAGLPVPF
jgi:hypothetical protein